MEPSSRSTTSRLRFWTRRPASLADFPDARTGLHAHQTLYSGLAFSRDGSHIYASMASLTDAKGDGKRTLGSGIAVYSFAEGKIAPERLIHLPIAPLATGTKDASARRKRQR